MDETQFLSSFPVDLNSASQTELEAIGLSAERAQAVVEYRAANGPFGSVEGLLDVPGFDRAALETLGARVSIDFSDGPDVDVEELADIADEPEKLLSADLEERETASDAADEVAAEDLDSPRETDLTGAPGAEEAEPAESVLQPEPDSGDEVVVREAESDGDELVDGIDDDLVGPLPAEEVAIESASVPEAEASEVQLQAEEVISEQGDRDTDAVSAAASDVLGAGESLASEGPVGDEVDLAGESEVTPTTDEVHAETPAPDSQAEMAEDAAHDIGLPDASTSVEAAHEGVEEDDKALVALPEELATHKDTSPPAVSEVAPDLVPFEPVHDDAVRTDDDAWEEARPDQGGTPDVAAAPVTEEAPGRQPEAAATPQPAPRERSRWHDVGMIALGGLLGVLATLVILGVVGGTLNYAPRRLVDAMNENLAVMQANQETTWSETQALVARADALDRRLSALEGLEDRIAALESGSAEIETRLADTAASLAQLDTQLAELAQSQALMFEEMDGRISGQGREISTLNDAVTSTRQTLQGVQDQVARYEAFFEALRSLLNDMQESAAAEAGA